MGKSLYKLQGGDDEVDQLRLENAWVISELSNATIKFSRLGVGRSSSCLSSLSTSSTYNIGESLAELHHLHHSCKHDFHNGQGIKEESSKQQQPKAKRPSRNFICILRIALFLILLLSIDFLGSIWSIGVIPWDTHVFGIVSKVAPGVAHFFTTKSPCYPPDTNTYNKTLIAYPPTTSSCYLWDINTFNKTLMSYATDDTRHRNVTQFGKIEKVLLNNKESLIPAYARLISSVSRGSHIGCIHSAFQDILSRRGTQKNYEPEVMQELLLSVKGPMDSHYQKWKSTPNSTSHHKAQSEALISQASIPLERYKSCAVVGNSGIIWNSSRGADIDNHEMVIRLNNAKVLRRNQTRVTASIGTKTTLTFMNSHIMQQCLKRFHRCDCHPYGVEVPIMLYLCTPEHTLSVACCTCEHSTPLLLTDGRFDMFVSRIAAWYSIKHYLDVNKGHTLQDWEKVHKHEFHYSSGLQAVILALALCDKVDIFGFGKHPELRHHFHSLQKVEHYGHDFEAEYLFYAALESKRIYDNPFLCEAGIDIPPLQVFQ